MASVNKVTIIGNLGKDPEVKYLPSGSAVCSISVATTRSWKSKETGEKQEETEWHRISFFDKLAEIAGQYLRKGKSVYIEGRLKTRKYTDKDGVERYSTDIIANEMVMLGGREGGGDGDYEQGGAPARQQSQSSQRQQPQRNSPPQQNRAPAQSHRQPAHSNAGGFDDMDDDIPF